MSDFTASTASVLLPAARISLFVKEEEIRQAAISLKNDWRFARVTIEVTDGDVESAIEYYSTHPSPDLVMVETLNMTDDFAGRLEILGSECAETTAAVVVGPINDVYLYRKLIEMGVSDYLVKPLSRDVLADVFAKILTERLGAQHSKLMACIGAKGGVGTSSLSYLLADAAGNGLNQKTVILDAAGGWSYLSVAMGGETVTNLHEAARAAISTDSDSFQRMIIPVSEKLSFLGTGAEPLMEPGISAEHFESIINRLMQTYPVVMVDLSGASIDIRRNILARANDVMIVSTPTLASLRSARSLMQEAKTIRGEKDDGLHIILNQKGNGSGFDVSETDMAMAFKVKPHLVLPFLPKLFGAAEAQGKPLSALSGGGEIFAAVQKFMEDKIGLSPDKYLPATAGGSKGGLLGGLLNKVKKK